MFRGMVLQVEETAAVVWLHLGKARRPEKVAQSDQEN